MINALHLIWIIPLSAMFGFIVAAFAKAAGRADATYNSVNIEEEQHK
jgi:hypothetical protein